MKNKAVLLLGSNMGDRYRYLQTAIEKIISLSNVLKQSAVYETSAWGHETQNAFLNMALQVETTTDAPDLLRLLKQIEKQVGRTLSERWHEREIDIDIIFFNNDVSQNELLTIPHPAMHKRRFTLVPLSEIVPDYIHPQLNKNVSQLLHECNDPLRVIKWEGR